MANLLTKLVGAEVSTLEKTVELRELLALEDIVVLGEDIKMKQLQQAYEKVKVYTYVVKDPKGGKTRRAYKEELEEPHEYVYANETVLMDTKKYKKFSILMWVVTGYSGYAKTAGFNIKFAKSGNQRKDTVVEEAIERRGSIKAAIEWWLSGEGEGAVDESLARAEEYKKGIKYADKGSSYKAYINWEEAANAVIGMRMASGGSIKSAKSYKYGKKLRPDEKAQFIRDYIKAEADIKAGTNNVKIRETEELCMRLRIYLDKYELFDTMKTRGILETLARTNYVKVTENQYAYLQRVLKDAEEHEKLETSQKTGASLWDGDDFLSVLGTYTK